MADNFCESKKDDSVERLYIIMRMILSNMPQISDNNIYDLGRHQNCVYQYMVEDVTEKELLLILKSVISVIIRYWNVKAVQLA